MLVDVVQMREGGRKLPPAELRAARPTRGILTLDSSLAMRSEDQPVVYAMLTNARMSEPLLPALRYARVAKLKGNQFVLHGEQIISMKPYGSSSTWKQGWWCRLDEDSDTVLVRRRELVDA